MSQNRNMPEQDKRIIKEPKKVRLNKIRESEALATMEEDGFDAARLMAARRFLRR